MADLAHGGIAEHAIAESGAGGGSATLIAAVAAFLLSAQPTAASIQFRCDTASFTAAAQSTASVTTSDPATFVVSGQTALATLSIAAGAASFSLSGNAAEQAWPAATAAFSLAGQDALFTTAAALQVGTFTLAGQSALFSATFAANAASFTFSGNAAEQAWPASVATFALSGSDAVFAINSVLNAASFTLSGGAAEQAWPVGAAAFNWSGQDVSFAASMSLGAGAFVLTGATAEQAWPASVATFALSPVAASANFGVVASAVEFNWFGYDTRPQFDLTGGSPTATGAIAEFGLAEGPPVQGFSRRSECANFALSAGDLLENYIFPADTAPFVVNTERGAIGFPVSAATYNWSGQQVSFTSSLAIDTGAFTLSGGAAEQAWSVDAAAYLLTGRDIAYTLARNADPATFVLSTVDTAFTGLDRATFVVSGQDTGAVVSLASDAATFTFSGQNANFINSVNLYADPADFLLNAQDVGFGRGMGADVGAFVLTGTPARVAARLVADPASFTFTGRPATFSAALRLLSADFHVYGWSVTDLTGPSGDHIFLIELQAHDGSSLRTFYLSGTGYTSLPTDTPANQYFRPLIRDPGNFERHLFAEGETRGKARVGLGDITLINTGELDDWLEMGFNGRTIIIRALPVGAPSLSAASVLFRGKMDRISSNNPLSELKVSIGDRLTDLEKPLVTQRFAGTTTSTGATAEGNADLKGQIKQMAWGECFNAPLQPANPYDLIYLASYVGTHTAIVSITVKDGGVALINDGDSANIAALLAASISPGHYRTCLAEGLVRLGGQPVYSLTADIVEGATSADRTAAQIAERMLLHYGVVLGDIVTGAFDTLDAKNAAICSYLVRDDRTALSAIQDVLDSIGGYLIPNREGPFETGRLEAPVASPLLTYNVEQKVRGKSLQMIDSTVPCWRVNLQWGPNYTVQNDADLAGSVSVEDRATVATEFRTITVEDASIKTQHLNARELNIVTYITDEAEAEAEADRQLALHGVLRSQYRVPFALADAWRAETGNALTLIHPDRFGWSGGKAFNVLGRADLYAKEKIELRVWG